MNRIQLMYWILNYNIDIQVAIIFYLLIFVIFYLLIKKQERNFRTPLPLVLITIISCLLTVFLMKRFGRSQQDNMRFAMEGIAPTYAYELEQLGHSKLDLNTTTDNPVYLAMIERQKEWLKLNRFINDVYTLRKDKNGKIILFVDSETDYNHNGIYEGDRESRTSIGELYNADSENINLAFKGKTVFVTKPVIDRWGAWVSVYEPMYAQDGKIDAVLGVDYNAYDWLNAGFFPRFSIASIGIMIYLIAIFFLYSLIKIRVINKYNQDVLSRECDISNMYFESSGVIMLVLDKEGKIIKINDKGAKTLGFEKSELINKSWLDNFLIDSEKEKVKEAFNKIISGDLKGAEYLENFIVLRNQEKKLIAWHNVFLRDNSGNIVNVLAAGVDITDINIFQEKLKTKIQELEEFQRCTVGRELRMIELKNEIAALKQKLAEKA